MNSKQFIIVVFILVCAGAVIGWSFLTANKNKTEEVSIALFPQEIGQWQGKDLPVGDDVYRILETRNLFIREYKNPQGDAVYLYIVYSKDDRKVSHPPEVCLLGAGETIVNKTPVSMTQNIKATQLIVEKQDTRQMVVYWFKAGDFFTDHYLKQQLRIVIGRMFGKLTSGALIRVSVNLKDNGSEAALGLLRQFSKDIEPLLFRFVP